MASSCLNAEEKEMEKKILLALLSALQHKQVKAMFGGSKSLHCSSMSILSIKVQSHCKSETQTCTAASPV